MVMDLPGEEPPDMILNQKTCCKFIKIATSSMNTFFV